MRSLLLCLLAGLFLCGCGPTTADRLVKDTGAQQMAAREVLTLVEGNTLFLRSFNEDAYLFFDGSGRLFGENTVTGKDSGRWDVSEGGELCVRMDKWWYGDLRCFSVYSRPETNRLHLAGSGGVLQFSAERQDGDAHKLYAKAGKRSMDQRKSIRTQEAKAEGKPMAETAAASPAQAVERQPVKPRTPAVIEDRPTGAQDSKDTGVTVAYMAKDCPGCNLAGADLGKAELIGAKLAGADLHAANLSMANLRKADLSKANLREAILAYANLPGADLRGADLRGAKLKGANLIKADLTGAKLEGADLSEVLKDGAKGL